MENMDLVARRHVSHAQTMLFVTSKQESARGLVFVLQVLPVLTVRIVSTKVLDLIACWVILLASVIC